MNNLLKIVGTALLLLPMTTRAQQHHDWEDQHILQINREPARAAFLPFGKTPGDRQLSLDGNWKFHWTKTPDEQPADFFREDFDDAAWKTFPVPGDWEMNGYGTPIYSSSGYTFKIDPPLVMGEPKKTYTAYVERNPTGIYRRTFTIPAAWQGMEVYIRFGAVSSAFYVWINGKLVGYSQGSMESAEFRITDYLRNAQQNQITLQVFKYSDGSYLEDQDMWRIAGIHRSVTLFATPKIRIRDFGVRTLLDENYKDALLIIHPELSVVGEQRGDGYTIQAELFDEMGKNCIDSTLTADASTMLNLDHKAAIMNDRTPQRGYAKWGWLSATVRNPKKWSAETPYLYTLRLSLVSPSGETIEQITTKVGFRRLEIRNGMFLVNGRQVRFRGVNRHEMDSRTGHVMTEKRMLQDILLMKRANINAVRTCHYPNTERWYELCDSLGLYVMDEADIEEHGLRGQLANDPSWAAAWLDRTQRMVIRDRNHPSVVLWSLGNEAGWGPNFALTAAWIHEYDPTRFVHYEGAQGSGEVKDPASVDVISRFYPRTQDEYLNPGVADNNMERPENARWERLLSIARDTTDNRPVLTSEYAHAMGNALGNFREYWDEIYSHPRMLGGFIWEWADEGIFKKRDDGKTMVAYGGDFGDVPNLKAFCVKGIVSSDRQTTPKYEEVKAVYAPLHFTYENGKVETIIRDDHITLDDYDITQKQADGYLTVTATLRNDKPWAKKGYVVARQQFEMAKSEKSGMMNEEIRIDNHPSFSILHPSFPAPHFFRAPTDNDKGFGNWIAKDWKNQGLDNLRDSVVQPLAERQLDDGTREYTAIHEYKALDGSIRTDYRYTIDPKGIIDFQATYTPQGNLPPLPCLGNTFVLPKDMQQLEYFGRGPVDNYPDRHEAALMGRWKSTAAQEYVHYPRPQDSGNHGNTSWLKVTDPSGHGWLVEDMGNERFSFSLLPYSVQHLYETAHDCDLQEDPQHVFLNIDCAVMGIGNSSCGPGVLTKYTIPMQPHTLHLRFTPIAGMRQRLFSTPQCDTIPYRIPAIAQCHNGNLLAVADFRYCKWDIGYGAIDLHYRISSDQGSTWGEERVLAKGTKTGKGNAWDYAFGDCALVADSQSGEVLVLCVGGKMPYPYSTRQNPMPIVRFRSHDNGETWNRGEDITGQIYGLLDHRAAGGVNGLFIGSGKICQSRTVKVGKYYRLYAAMLTRSGVFVIYSDDFGERWQLLGDAETSPCPKGNEPKCEELPDGSVLLSARTNGRYYNIFTFSDRKKATGHWQTCAKAPAMDGIQNSCNGEILLVRAQRKADGKPTWLLLQSVPFGPERTHVGFFYKDLGAKVKHPTVETIITGWQQALQVSGQSSAYSTMVPQHDGRIAFLWEEGPEAYNIDYCPLTLEEITQGAYR